MACSRCGASPTGETPVLYRGVFGYQRLCVDCYLELGGGDL